MIDGFALSLSSRFVKWVDLFGTRAKRFRKSLPRFWHFFVFLRKLNVQIDALNIALEPWTFTTTQFPSKFLCRLSINHTEQYQQNRTNEKLSEVEHNSKQHKCQACCEAETTMNMLNIRNVTIWKRDAMNLLEYAVMFLCFSFDSMHCISIDFGRGRQSKEEEERRRRSRSCRPHQYSITWRTVLDGWRHREKHFFTSPCVASSSVTRERLCVGDFNLQLLTYCRRWNANHLYQPRSHDEFLIETKKPDKSVKTHWAERGMWKSQKKPSRGVHWWFSHLWPRMKIKNIQIYFVDNVDFLASYTKWMTTAPERHHFIQLGSDDEKLKFRVACKSFQPTRLSLINHFTEK